MTSLQIQDNGQNSQLWLHHGAAKLWTYLAPWKGFYLQAPGAGPQGTHYSTVHFTLHDSAVHNTTYRIKTIIMFAELWIFYCAYNMLWQIWNPLRIVLIQNILIKKQIPFIFRMIWSLVVSSSGWNQSLVKVWEHESFLVSGNSLWAVSSSTALFVLSLPHNLARTELLSNYVLNSRVSDKIIAIYGPVQNNNCN